MIIFDNQKFFCFKVEQNLLFTYEEIVITFLLLKCILTILPFNKELFGFQIHLLYQDMMQKRAEVERLQAQGRNKYEYDSDEDVEGGTWEHRAREKEMIATKEWASKLTEMARGKHHIGDFLPPEELKKFMDKWVNVLGFIIFISLITDVCIALLMFPVKYMRIIVQAMESWIIADELATKEWEVQNFSLNESLKILLNTPSIEGGKSPG